MQLLFPRAPWVALLALVDLNFYFILKCNYYYYYFPAEQRSFFQLHPRLGVHVGRGAVLLVVHPVGGQGVARRGVGVQVDPSETRTLKGLYFQLVEPKCFQSRGST